MSACFSICTVGGVGVNCAAQDESRNIIFIYVQVVVSGARNEEFPLADALTALAPIAKMKAEAKARQTTEVVEEAVSPEPMPVI